MSASCTSKAEREVTEILDQREKAFEKKDVELYKTLISERYNQKLKNKIINKDQVVKNFATNVLPFDSIEVRHRNREITLKGNTAIVLQQTIFSLRIDNESSTYTTTELLKIEKTDKGWKIVKESDIDLLRGFVFGEGKSS